MHGSVQKWGKKFFARPRNPIYFHINELFSAPALFHRYPNQNFFSRRAKCRGTSPMRPGTPAQRTAPPGKWKNHFPGTSKSLFAAAHPRVVSLAPPEGSLPLLYVVKNSSRGATCGRGPAPLGRGLVCAKAKHTAPPAMPEGPWPSCRTSAGCPARGFPR